MRYIFWTKKQQKKVDHQSYDSLIINLVTHAHSFTCLLVPVPQVSSYHLWCNYADTDITLNYPVLSSVFTVLLVLSGLVWSGLVWPESDQNLSEYNHCSPTWLTMSGPVSPHLLVNQTHHPYNTPDTHCIAHIQGKQIKGFIFHDF